MQIRGTPWSDAENEATVADYFDMLVKELIGQSYNKSVHRRNLKRMLHDRSDTAIERKHQNISAILLQARYPYIRGYKPLSQYQHSLSDVVHERLEEDESLRELVVAYACADTTRPHVRDVLGMMRQPPDLLESVRIALAAQRQRRAIRGVDYLALEAQNRNIGAGGESLVVGYERARLSSLGCGALADRVEQVSVTRGDGLGYDVLSFEPTGRERFLEVKTTKLGPLTPFYLTSNELSFSVERPEQYSLYRVYDYVSAASIFTLDGALDVTCELQPAQFIAIPKCS